MRIDPWGAEQYADYARLRDEFGIEPVEPATWSQFDDPHPLFERGVVFGARGLTPVLEATARGDPVGLMTGLMPSGRMHFGHKTVIDQVIWWQNHGADVNLGVADYEAYATRGIPLDKARRIALEEYVLTYLALGLDPDKATVYFQSRRRRVKDLAYRLAAKANWSQMKATYGFDDDTSVAHLMAPMVQAADILHIQDGSLGGPRPTIVPVGVDQDPHIRLTRDVAAAFRLYSVRPTKKDGLGVFVKPKDPPRPVKDLLDDVETVLRDEMGFSDVRRKDDYGAVYIKSGGAGDVGAVDLALARLEAKQGRTAYFAPSSTYHRFMSGLPGGKMSSSAPETAVFVTDDAEVAEQKLRKAKTGGRESAQEQREKGADPTVCSVYEFYLYHLAKDAKHLATVFDECTTGKRLCGECKSEASGLLTGQLGDLKAKREASRDLLADVVSAD